MQSTDIPDKFNIPFANNAGGGFVRPIPQASQIGINDGFASLHDGFPPLNATPRDAGGVPPFIQDMNGILQQVTAWNRWMASGAPALYDGVFQSAIGGYPRGATVLDSSYAFWYMSTVENNMTNPNTGGAGWRKIDLADYVTKDEFSNQFSSGSNANGYWRKSPDGQGGFIIDQWGKKTALVDTFTVITFPIPFTVASSVSGQFSGAVMHHLSQDNNPAVAGDRTTTTKMEVFSAVNVNVVGYWRAVGV